MTDKRVKVPEEAKRFVEAGLTVPEDLAMALLGARRLAQWTTEHPIVPTDEQLRRINRHHGFHNLDLPYARAVIIEFQRRFMFTEPEPEDPLADLWLRPIGKPSEYGICGGEEANNRILEAFKRGQQSMIRKDG